MDAQKKIEMPSFTFLQTINTCIHRYSLGGVCVCLHIYEAFQLGFVSKGVLVLSYFIFMQK